MNVWTGHETNRRNAMASSALKLRVGPSAPAPLVNRHMTARAMRVAQIQHQSGELEDAREVQQQLLPQRGPAVDGLDYAGRCRPAASVGGDYYDFLPGVSDSRSAT